MKQFAKRLCLTALGAVFALALWAATPKVVDIPSAEAVKIRTAELEVAQDAQHLTALQVQYTQAQAQAQADEQRLAAQITATASALKVDTTKYTFDEAKLAFVAKP